MHGVWVYLYLAVEHGLPQRDPELLQLLTPHGDSLLDARTRPRLPQTLRGALRSRLREDESQEASEDLNVAVDDDILEHTQGKRALIVGGDERSNARERIQAAFGFAELRWDRAHQTRRVQATAARIREGSVDVVIFLRRFLSHRTSNILVPATQQPSGPLSVWVDQGYGVVAVQRALAQALRGELAR